MNPSAWATARRSAAGCDPPNQIGGPPAWTGLGDTATPRSWKKRPSRSTVSSLHTRRITVSPSLNLATKLVRSTPNASNLRNPPPVPRPISSRPLLRWSTEAIDLARCSGLVSELTSTAQPRRIRSVHAAA